MVRLKVWTRSEELALTCLESYFAQAEDIRILLATRRADQLLKFLESNRVDVFITDIHMETMDGTQNSLLASSSFLIVYSSNLFLYLGASEDATDSAGDGAATGAADPTGDGADSAGDG